MKWYESIRPGGSHTWWTQRDKAGVCYTIKQMDTSKKFKLLINDKLENSKCYDTLPEAIFAVSKMWNNGEGKYT